jgi:hypothetical protein
MSQENNESPLLNPNEKIDKQSKDSCKKVRINFRISAPGHSSSDMSFQVTNCQLIANETESEDNASNLTLDSLYPATENSSTVSMNTNRKDSDNSINNVEKQLERNRDNSHPAINKLQRKSSILSVIESSKRSELLKKEKSEKTDDKGDKCKSSSLKTQRSVASSLETSHLTENLTKELENKDEDYDPNEFDDTFCSDDEKSTQGLKEIDESKSKIKKYRNSSVQEKRSYFESRNLHSNINIRNPISMTPSLRQKLHLNNQEIKASFSQNRVGSLLEENLDTNNLVSLPNSLQSDKPKDLFFSFQSETQPLQENPTDTSEQASVTAFSSSLNKDLNSDLIVRHEKSNSVLITQNDDEYLSIFSKNKDLESNDKSTLKSSLFSSSDDSEEIMTRNINVKMNVAKKNEERSTSFFLLENEKKKEFICPEMPNVLIRAFRNDSFDENTTIQMKIFEVSSAGAKETTKKLVGDFEMILRPDQREKKFEFLDDFQNKISIKLKKKSN